MDYKDYPIFALWRRYNLYRKEREEIELHLATRSEAENKEFFQLKNQHYLQYYLRNLLYEGKKVAEHSKTQLERAEKLKEYDFAVYKHNLDLVLKSMLGDESGMRKILYEEAIKQNRKLTDIQEECKNLTYQDDKSIYFKCASQISNCIGYIHQLQLKSHRQIIEQISGVSADSEIELSKPVTQDKNNEVLKYGPFPSDQPQIVFVLFIYYLQMAGIAQPFTERKTKQEIKELAEMYNRNPTTFYQKYSLIQKVQNRLIKGNVKNIKAAIMLLTQFSEAKDFAISELNKINNL